MSKITASEVVLCATNEGELYQMHKAMARLNKPLCVWQRFIETRFMPIYRRHSPEATISRAVLRDAAKKLKAYYVEHLKEF